ncbi:MAG: hypothetical protein V2A56_04305 [bacterium]
MTRDLPNDRKWFYVPIVVVCVAGMIWAMSLYAMSSRMGGGDYVYPSDDSYIHLALARNLAFHGVWSVNPDGFTPASSSPLWTVLLAVLFRIFGFHAAAPFFINLILMLLLLLILDDQFRKHQISAPTRILLLLAVLVGAPLLVTVCLGMEHVLHAILTILVLNLGERLIADDGDGLNTRSRVVMMALAALLTATRYEGLALIVPLSVLLVLRRRWGFATGLLLVSLVPPVLYALYATSQGGPPLPNTAYLKGVMDHPPDVFTGSIEDWVFWHGIQPIRMNSFMYTGVALGAFALIHYLRRGMAWSRAALTLMLTATMIIAHLIFSETNNLYRHEMYLHVLIFYVFGREMKVSVSSWFASLRSLPHSGQMGFAILLLLFLLFPAAHDLARRTWLTLRISEAMEDIRDQPLETARLFREYFAGETVVIHDPGAVALDGNVRVIDLWGLASTDVMRLQQAGKLTSEAVDSLSRAGGASVAVLYDGWLNYRGGIPGNWVPIASLTLPDNIASAFPRVSIFATSASAAPRVARAVQLFSLTLPEEVTLENAYLPEN